jgi:hypothetical protein
MAEKEKPNPNANQINIELSEEIAEGLGDWCDAYE